MKSEAELLLLREVLSEVYRRAPNDWRLKGEVGSVACALCWVTDHAMCGNANYVAGIIDQALAKSRELGIVTDASKLGCGVDVKELSEVQSIERLFWYVEQILEVLKRVRKPDANYLVDAMNSDMLKLGEAHAAAMKLVDRHRKSLADAHRFISNQSTYEAGPFSGSSATVTVLHAAEAVLRNYADTIATRGNG